MPLDKSALFARATVAASATDAVMIAGYPGRRIRVIGFLINQGDTTPSSVTFNSKPAGAGTAISPALKAAANGTVGGSSPGWFETVAGEGLSVTTGVGSTTGILVSYTLVSA